MTRKLQKPTLKVGQRRSPRISAMEAWKTHGSGSGSGSAGDPVVHPQNSRGKSGSTCTDKMRRHLDNDEGPAFRTRARKRRKLRPVEELTPSSVTSPHKQGGKKSDDEDIKENSDQPSKLPSATFIPEKRILELVLDILQRRDTHEIFAEPVDPKEVEDYYEIIEEPMDFGTMRAKLHEGLYKSLEQFEHDVFLIFNNAMHFNSSGTIYFRQARTINELAKKVFSVLKANPENFELEFSETRQRAGRRNQGDFRDSTNVKFSESTISMSSKIMSCSSHAAPNRRSFKSNHGRSDVAKHIDARDIENPVGTREGGRYKSFEVDKRCTYRPSLSLGEDESISSTVYGKLKLLEHVNQQDIGYRESLMLFVKDLGQAAQNVVRRKLLGCQIHTASASAPWRPNILNTDTAPMCLGGTRRPKDSINLEIANGDETVYAKVEGILNAGKGEVHSPFKENIQGSQRMPIGCDKGYEDESLRSDLYFSRASADKLKCSADGSKETGSKSATDISKSIIREQPSESLAVERSRTVSRSRFENKHEFRSQSCPSHFEVMQDDRSQTRNLRSEHIRGESENLACSFEAGKIDQTVPSATSFILNLPYLKTKLHQINSSREL